MIFLVNSGINPKHNLGNTEEQTVLSIIRFDYVLGKRASVPRNQIYRSTFPHQVWREYVKNVCKNKQTKRQTAILTQP